MESHTREQKVIARSSAEAELDAAALGASESKETVVAERSGVSGETSAGH